MGAQVTDPALLAQLNGDAASAPKQVTDPALLAQLNSDSPDIQAAPEQPVTLSQIGRNFLNATMRPIIKAVGTIPEMSANAGVGLRNLSEQAVNRMAPNFAHAIYNVNQQLAGDSQLMQAIFPQAALGDTSYGSFSSHYQPIIESMYGKPGGDEPAPGVEENWKTKLLRLGNKGAEGVSTAIVGGSFPGPQAAQQAPAGFTRAITTPRDLSLEAGQNAGYVVPPSTVNPSTSNKFLESLGGKEATAIDAALKNQSVTNSLARKAVGLAENEPISKGALEAVRKEAGDAYKVLRGVGDVELDKQATQGLDDIVAKYTSSDLAKAISGGNDIPKIVQAVKDESLTGTKIVDAIALLRDKANAAYGSGDKALGGAYKQVSKQLEDLMERNLSGGELSAFRDARTLIAKTYTVEKALNDSTGNVVATKLASQLAKGKPLTGELATAARFAGIAPQAAKEVVSSPARHTDVALGGLAAVLEHQPWYLAFPFARLGAREGLLSQTGQRLLTQPGMQVPPGLIMGQLPMADSLTQQ